MREEEDGDPGSTVALLLLSPTIAGFTEHSSQIGVLARIILINTALQGPNVLAFLALQLERRIVTVTALDNQICPDGTAGCYQVMVAQSPAPRYFSPVLGSYSPSLSGSALAGGRDGC